MSIDVVREGQVESMPDVQLETVNVKVPPLRFPPGDGGEGAG